MVEIVIIFCVIIFRFGGKGEGGGGNWAGTMLHIIITNVSAKRRDVNRVGYDIASSITP